MFISRGEGKDGRRNRYLGCGLLRQPSALSVVPGLHANPSFRMRRAHAEVFRDASMLGLFDNIMKLFDLVCFGTGVL